MIWIATASILYPNSSPTRTVSKSEIVKWVHDHFRTEITPVMIDRHRVSWIDRQCNENDSTRGGSRNRYLFKTLDGLTPSEKGDFRLYKRADGKHDGWDKIGKSCPQRCDLAEEYGYIVEWYATKYYPES